MNVRLIALTQSCLPEVSTAEDLIVHNARVSNPNNQLNTLTGAKLLSYCIRHGHWSVFEQADMTVEIKTSRAIAAQILRHRSFSFQEFSQRYADAPGMEPVEIRRQASKNRQSSTEVMDWFELDVSVPRVLEYLQTAYDTLIKNGASRECARMVLPLATSTTLYMKGSVRSWIHYMQVRRDEHTQKEHRLIADEIWKLFAEQFQVIATAIEDTEK